MGKIIWLASYPKSGNTWLRAFLHNVLRNPKKPFDINELSCFCMQDSSAYRYEELAGKAASRLTKQEIAALRPGVQAMMTTVYPDAVFAKTHNALVVDRGTPMIAMEHTVAAIYVVRNPLDLVISLADHTGETIDGATAQMARDTETENSNEIVYGRQGSWSSNVASWTHQAHRGLHVVRYEDALADPLNVFGGVVKFLGLNPPLKRLEKAITFSSFESLRAQEDRAGFKERTAHQERFFRSGQSGQWREILSESQVSRIVKVHREQMARFGYLPDTH